MNSHQRGQLRVFALRVLKQADGIPMGDIAMRGSIRDGYRHVTVTETELGDLLRGLEAEGYIAGATSKLDGNVVWMLTDKGEIAAAQ
jgi:hypothetical protein